MTTKQAVKFPGFIPGQRVQMHPATDLWMRGARYGNVTKVTSKYVYVKLDALPRPVRVHSTNLLNVD